MAIDFDALDLVRSKNKAKEHEKNKPKPYTVRMTKDHWYYADVYAKDEQDALKVAEQMHNDGKLDIKKNDNQEGDWHYDFADLNE